jgi:aspartyl-tRNA(Asn)/glutamyl-tRNA(Gln) amidotransferase subunit B
VLREAFQSGRSPDAIVSERGLGRIQDSDVVAQAVSKAVAANPRAVADYKAGKAAALQALIGPVMKETRGRADPAEVRALLQLELDKTP